MLWGMANQVVAAPLRLGSAVFGERGAFKANALAQRLPAGFKRDRVRATRRGVRYELDLRDNVQHALFYAGWYDRALTRRLLTEARPGDVYVDVGAHIGVLALPMARQLRRLGGGRVLAFEPAPDNAGRLRHAASRNHLDNLDVIEAALGASAGTAALRVDPSFSNADTGVRSLYADGAAAFEVSVLSFDDWRSDRGLDRLDLVKIDVEGGELDVLRGMTDAITHLKPRLIVFEVKDELLRRAGSTRAELEQIVSDLGYRSSVDGFGDEQAVNVSLVPASR